jgi:hypothetical protein
MSYEKKEYKPYPDSGQLRASAIKKGDKSPDYWGDIAINLKDLTNIHTEDGLTIVKLSGWKKTDKSGKTFLSLSVNRYVPEGKISPQRQDDDSSDVPF